MKVKRQKYMIKTAAVLLAASFIFLRYGFPDGGASVLAGKTAEVSSGEGNVFEGVSYRDRYYYSYVQKHTSVLPAVDEIVLFSGTEGNSETISLGYGDSVEYSITASEDLMYGVSITYMRNRETAGEMLLSLLLDGESIFAEADAVELGRMFRDETDILRDPRGNDLIPSQEEVFSWQDTFLTDHSGWNNEPLKIMIPKGEHVISFLNSGSPLFISGLVLTPPADRLGGTDSGHPVKYGQTGPAEDVLIKIQAENTYMKSCSMIYPVYDRTSPATEPYHHSKIRRNTIGQNNWSRSGMWVSYKIDDVPEDGYYDLTLKYRQNLQIGMSVYRDVYVNGIIPGKEFADVAFPYDLKWHKKTISGKDGVPTAVYLMKGSNEIRIQVTTGPTTEVLREIDDINSALNLLYLRVIMVTGKVTDIYRDYNLDREIPGLMDECLKQADRLRNAFDEYTSLSGGDSTKAQALLRAAEQLESFVEDPVSIPQRLSNFQDTKSSLADWLFESLQQPLELDYIMIHSQDTVIPRADADLWSRMKHYFASFFASFTEDYSTIGDVSASDDSIDVWVSTGRDQIQILKDLTMDSFTPMKGIDVNLSQVQSGLIEATLAGTGPDVSIGIARGQPVNLACRGVLADLSRLDGFDDVMKRFGETAGVPYVFGSGTYALPNTQTFYMMFYRRDVLDMLGMEPPETWTGLLRMLPRLQKNHMSVGLPYSIVSAVTIVDNGMGLKDLFPVLLMQKGGKLYTDDLKGTDLTNETAMDAFREWTDFYVKYGFDLAYDLYSRFRSGEMPIAIASYEMYNNLMVGAPEIRNQWAMVPIPGTMREGVLDRTVAGSGTAAVILNSNPGKTEKAWEYLKWWTGEDIQYRYGMSVENILGAAGRYTTANIAAFEKLPWTREALDLLRIQRKQIREIPEIPGSYIVSRSLDNAFRAVLFDKDNPREAFEGQIKTMDREIARKRAEFGLEP
ncbi:MAG: extracellular solute-binding protein [Saccharofermentanales bacterium]